jgi:hypothetical protein
MLEISDLQSKVNRMKTDNEKTISEFHKYIKMIEEMEKNFASDIQTDKQSKCYALTLKLILAEYIIRSDKDSAILETMLDFFEFNLNHIENLNDSIIKLNIKDETKTKEFADLKKQIISERKIVREFKNYVKNRRLQSEKEEKHGSSIYG